MAETQNPTWLDRSAADWLFRFLAMCYIEEKVGLKDEDKKMVDGLKRDCVKILHDYYDDMKRSGGESAGGISSLLDGIFGKDDELSEAKKLLEDAGYDVTAKMFGNVLCAVATELG